MAPDAPRSARTLAFAVVSGDPAARASLELLGKELGERVGCIVYPQLLTSYDMLKSQMIRGRIHLAWTPPLVAIELEKARAGAPVVCSRRKFGAAYHSVVFTQTDRKVAGPDELAGLRAAWVDRSSLSGYRLAQQWLVERGLNPTKLFRDEIFLRTHSAVCRSVLDGSADCGATYANVDPSTGRIRDAGWFEVGGSHEDIHVVTTIGPIPADVVLVSTRVDPSIRDALADALVDLSGPGLGALRVLFRADGFTKVRPEYLAAAERLLRS